MVENQSEKLGELEKVCRTSKEKIYDHLNDCGKNQQVTPTELSKWYIWYYNNLGCKSLSYISQHFRGFHNHHNDISNSRRSHVKDDVNIQLEILACRVIKMDVNAISLEAQQKEEEK